MKNNVFLSRRRRVVFKLILNFKFSLLNNCKCRFFISSFQNSLFFAALRYHPQITYQKLFYFKTLLKLLVFSSRTEKIPSNFLMNFYSKIATNVTKSEITENSNTTEIQCCKKFFKYTLSSVNSKFIKHKIRM